MRQTSRCIIFKDDKLVLIYREKGDEKYYVFPGGGIEENETKEEAVIREAKEELGIVIETVKYVYEEIDERFHTHFYLCNWISGELGTGDECEYDKNRIGGLQLPMLVDVKELSNINIKSDNIKRVLIEDINKFGYELDTIKKNI